MTHTALPANSHLSSRAWGILILAAVLWYGLLNQLKGEWSINAQYSYGWGVPLLAIYLVWKKWSPDLQPKSPPRSKALPAIAAGLLLLALLPIRLLQEANPDWRLVSWIYALDVVALTLLAVWRLGGNPWLRAFWLPVAFILIAVPWPTPIEQAMVQSLMRWVAGITVEIVHWFGVPAVQRGNLIDLPTGIVGVDEACSGVRSFQAMLMASIFLGEMYQFRLRHRFMVIAAGAVLSFGFNVVRTLALTWVNIKRGAAGHDAWHDPAGYVVLACAFVTLWLVCLWFEKLEKRQRESKRDALVNSNAPFPLTPALSLGEREKQPTEIAVPTDTRSPSHSPANSLSRFPLLLVAAWIVFVELGAEGWYALHEKKLSEKVTWSVAWPEKSEGLVYDKIPEETQLLLRYSSGKAAHWRRVDQGTQWLIYHFVWSPGRAAAQLARNHSPEACLPAGGLKFVRELGLKTFKAAGLDLPFRTYRFDADGRPCLVYFCLWEDRANGAHKPADYSRSSRLDAVLAGERHLGQRVLEIAMVGESNESAAERAVEKFLQQTIRVP